MINVIDNIYLSSSEDALNAKLIEKNKIKHVFRISSKTNMSPYDSSIIYSSLDVDDSEDASDKMLKINKIILKLLLKKKIEENVLVHCNMGRSRSAAFIIYYLMVKHGMSYDDAYGFLKEKKPDIDLNSGFVKMLQNSC